MNEGELIEMGLELKKKFQDLEKEKKKFEEKCNALKRNLILLYVFSRELDMMIEDENTFPTIMRYMIERMRGMTSQMLIPDMNDDMQVNFEFFLL
tara:strand:- start:44 stop:328 length:285 start_codon:yes stop_codon:yes gene_type:complete